MGCDGIDTMQIRYRPNMADNILDQRGRIMRSAQGPSYSGVEFSCPGSCTEASSYVEFRLETFRLKHSRVLRSVVRRRAVLSQ